MAGEAEAAAAAAAASAAAAAAANAPWHQGIADPEMVGHWTNKGWDAADPKKIAVEATKAHREAERKLGIPSDEIVRFPKNPAGDTEAMKAIWERLGTPKEAKDYDFPALKDKDGKIADARLDATLREGLFKAGTPKEMAATVAALVVKHEADVQSAKDADAVANLAKEQETLAKNWGVNAPANKVIAQNAAQALGMTKEEVDALESVIGYARTMETLRNIGTKIGEAKFIRPDGPGGPQIVSREQASARIVELKQDTAWVKRLMEGDVATKREFDNLSKISVGDDIEGRF